MAPPVPCPLLLLPLAMLLRLLAVPLSPIVLRAALPVLGDDDTRHGRVEDASTKHHLTTCIIDDRRRIHASKYAAENPLRALVLRRAEIYLVGALAAASVAADDNPVVVGQTFLARSQDPTDGSAPWALTSHGVAEKLFTVNEKDEIVPQVAASVNKVDGLSFEVQPGEDTPVVWDLKLKPGYKFSDGTEVNAERVANALMELNKENDNAKSSLGTIVATPRDNLTVRIESEIQTHIMDAVLAEWVFAVYYKDADENFVYTGPYLIEHFVVDDEIDLRPNPNYIDGKSLERPLIHVRKYPDGTALAEGLEKGEVDVAFHLPIDTLPSLREAGIRVKRFEVGYHYMMLYNLDSLPDMNVRRAIDVAIDRSALAQALAGGDPTRSLFPEYSPYHNEAGENYGEMEQAAALLDEAGYTLNSNGKREKDGEVLSINLVAYPHRPGLGIMQPLIAESLRDLGIEVKETLMSFSWSDTNYFQDIIDGRTFDILMLAQHTLPAGDPLWFLSTYFGTDGANNHANLSSDAIDCHLAELSLAEDMDERVALTTKAHNEILKEVAVSNLVTPEWHVGLSERMADYKPWGSDYYVIRPDLFVSAIKTDAPTLEPSEGPSPSVTMAKNPPSGSPHSPTKSPSTSKPTAMPTASPSISSQSVTDNENPAEIELDYQSSASSRQVVGLLLLALYALASNTV